MFKLMGEMCSHDPVEESVPHYHCSTTCFTNTVFDRLPVTPSITSFEKLPNFSIVSVFEDVLTNPEQHNQPINGHIDNVDHHVPPTDTTVQLTRATLKTHQEKCSNFLKNKTPNIKEMKELVSDMIELVEKMAAQYPTYFSVKPIYVFQPEMKERLTFGDLEDHQEKWRVILQNSHPNEIQGHMSETLHKMELVVLQIEYCEKEMKTLRESKRQMEIINEQQEQLEDLL